MKVDGRKMICHEKVTGKASGGDDAVTDVESVLELLPQGGLLSKARYLKAGAWVDGREITYAEAPGEKVTFK